jgi:hypothetical protein
MTLEFNDRGKYFTDIISKVAVSAVIQTVMHRIEGAIHVRLDGRVKDELDLPEAFLAVTDAKIFNADGSLAYQADFMTISRSQIVWVIPGDDPAHSSSGE